MARSCCSCIGHHHLVAQRPEELSRFIPANTLSPGIFPPNGIGAGTRETRAATNRSTFGDPESATTIAISSPLTSIEETITKIVAIVMLFISGRTSKASYTCPWARPRLRVGGGMVMVDRTRGGAGVRSADLFDNVLRHAALVPQRSSRGLVPLSNLTV